MKTVKTFILICIAFLTAFSASAQHDGHDHDAEKKDKKPVKIDRKPGHYKVKVKIAGFNEKECYLGYHFADKQYIMDTTTRSADGSYTFEDNFGLEAGIYMIIMPPKNRYFEMLVDKTDQTYNIETDTLNMVKSMKVTQSDDNKHFYDYLNYINTQRESAEPLRKEYSAAKDEKQKDALKIKLDNVDKNVVNYQADVLKKYPKSMLALVMRSTKDPKIPELKKKNGDVDTLGQFTYYKSHFFDDFDFTDDRLIRTPILRQKWTRYISQLTVQHPDSISLACDYLIERAKPNREMYKYFITELLNEYAGSKIVGYDAVYVHLAKKYYCTTPPAADWVDQDVLENICKDANALDPLLLGKIAPNIKMLRIAEGTDWKQQLAAPKVSDTISLHNVKSPYTIVIFWDTECSHCQKSMPVVADFYDKYKNLGIEVFAVCTRTYTDYDACWKMIKEKNWTKWLNVGDPYMQSRYKQVYDIKTTPQMYLLDKDKRIIMKKISAEQFEKEIPRIIEMNEKKPKK